MSKARKVIETALLNYSLGIHECICKGCGKKFIRTKQWAYKESPSYGNPQYFCTYTCLVKYQKIHPKFKSKLAKELSGEIEESGKTRIKVIPDSMIDEICRRRDEWQQEFSYIAKKMELSESAVRRRYKERKENQNGKLQ